MTAGPVPEERAPASVSKGTLSKRAAAVALGAGLAALSPVGQRPFRGVGAITVVGLIYPVARRGWQLDRDLGVELAHAALFAAADVVAPTPRSRALAWVAHGAFDMWHGKHADHGRGDSLLPWWYAEACAGYDVVIAYRLLRSDPAG